jgi:hypothetical protein
MRTPAGTECPFFFEDYYRGRQRQECRLLARPAVSGRWAPDLCGKCAVPRIHRANACPSMILEAQVQSGMLGIGRRVVITANCTRSLGEVAEPEIGCGMCHLPEESPRLGKR